jgi:hypothetical protein
MNAIVGVLHEGVAAAAALVPDASGRANAAATTARAVVRPAAATIGALLIRTSWKKVCDCM